MTYVAGKCTSSGSRVIPSTPDDSDVLHGVSSVFTNCPNPFSRDAMLFLPVVFDRGEFTILPFQTSLLFECIVTRYLPFGKVFPRT